MHDVPFPPSLVEWQTWFAKILVSPIQESDSANIPLYPPSLIQEIGEKIAPSPTLKSEERMGIYQQQYWWRLLSIMQELFPSLVAIFDYKQFNALIAEPYLSEYPPSDWFISNIGSRLPQWLDKMYKKKDGQLLIQLAHIDLACETLLFTEILTKIDSATLSQCETKTLFLQPFVLLFELNADLFAFRAGLLGYTPTHWQTNRLPQCKKSRKKRFFALYRNQENTLYDEISPPFFALLSSFKKGAKLTEVLFLLESSEKIVESFQLMASRGWLTLKDPSLQ